ncbi:transcription termination factor NusA [Patescibacteria group bacterium]|nr:transcription termination factor NusA [Patescibacteria group bacterium]
MPSLFLEASRQAQAEEDAKQKADSAAQENFLEEPKKVSQDEEVQEDSDEFAQDTPKFNPKTDIMHSDARVLKMDAEIGDEIRTELPLPGEFGRMAAMTAKQVITQKLREAEREIVFGEFKEQEGEVLIGTVQRREGRLVLVDLGRTVGVLPNEEQIRSERYNSGDRIKVYVKEVSLGTRGPQIILSRASEELVRSLFDLEIPEIADGTIEIMGIAREAGARSKVAVKSNDDSVDPIGACIGQRGVRIQTIINELSGEKIDIIEWNEDVKDFIVSALAPAKIKSITLDEETKEAEALVDSDQLSLAIGRGGQNVRLAAKLTGWKLSVKGIEVEDDLPGDKVEDESDSDSDEDEIIEEEE